MALTTYRPGDVEAVWYDDDSGLYPHDPATVVGSAAQWSDDSDATYAIADTPADSVSSEQTAPWAQFDPHSFDVVNAVTLRFRASSTSVGRPGSEDREVAAEIRPARFDTDPDGIRTSVTLVDDGAIHDYEVPLLPAWWMTPEDVAYWEPIYRTTLAAGLRLAFFSIGYAFPALSWHEATTIYEVWLDVDAATVSVISGAEDGVRRIFSPSVQST